jgi:hypothetical protein
MADFVAEVGCEGAMGRCGPILRPSRLPLAAGGAATATLTTLQQQDAVQVTLRRGTQPGFQAAPVS